MVQVGDYLRPLMLKDLRTQCRARGLNPGGSREALAERVGEHMTQTQDFTIFKEAPAGGYGGSNGGAARPLASADELAHANNYSRPNGQNVGNHITDRPSSRVLAPPGGASQVHFGNYDEPPLQQAAPGALADVSNQGYSHGRSPEPVMMPKSPVQQQQQQQPQGSPQRQGHFSGHGMSRADGNEVNNYGRPEGQNVGNFLSDRPSSRVLAPPGGASQVFFG